MWIWQNENVSAFFCLVFCGVFVNGLEYFIEKIQNIL